MEKRKNIAYKIIASIGMVVTFFVICWDGNVSMGNVDINGKVFNVKIVQTREAMQKGLGDERMLCDNCGMLFVFDGSDNYDFWMKDVNFDIDMVWIDNYEVVDITKNVAHNNQFKIINSKKKADLVLEINSGKIEASDIEIGQNVSVQYFN
ncbi:MAG: DUF192 domain-containing protein [Candidatus Moraniibacteriota bacterium]|jgi:uncharacterized protein